LLRGLRSARRIEPIGGAMTGGCLCGAVRFRVRRFVGPFELCHCNRCRKATGSAFAAMIGVRVEDFAFLSGQELVASYEAPILQEPPAYRTAFCSRCGSPAPNPEPTAAWLEIHAGLLDGDPGLKPERHILVEHKASWYEIEDLLPQLEREALARLRAAAPR
jgi:hypothetical protein